MSKFNFNTHQFARQKRSLFKVPVSFSVQTTVQLSRKIPTSAYNVANCQNLMRFNLNQSRLGRGSSFLVKIVGLETCYQRNSVLLHSVSEFKQKVFTKEQLWKEKTAFGNGEFFLYPVLYSVNILFTAYYSPHTIHHILFRLAILRVADRFRTFHAACFPSPQNLLTESCWLNIAVFCKMRYHKLIDWSANSQVRWRTEIFSKNPSNIIGSTSTELGIQYRSSSLRSRSTAALSAWETKKRFYEKKIKPPKQEHVDQYVHLFIFGFVWTGLKHLNSLLGVLNMNFIIWTSYERGWWIFGRLKGFSNERDIN